MFQLMQFSVTSSSGEIIFVKVIDLRINWHYLCILRIIKST